MRPDDNSSTGRGQYALVGVAVIVAFLAGLFLGRGSDSETETPRKAPAPVTSPDEQIVNGVPVGYARTKEGAVEAATNFTRVMASVPDDDDAYLAAAETMAAPDWKEDARRLAQNGLRFLRDRYGDGGSFTFSPLRYRVIDYSDDSASIAVWGVTVASGPKIRGLEESWLTGTLELVWIDDWRLAGQSSETGPTPELLQTQDGVSADALGDFQEYNSAPSP